LAEGSGTAAASHAGESGFARSRSPAGGIQSEAAVLLAGSVELGRLVDLVCARRGLAVVYDPSKLKATLTIRDDAGLSDEELWDLTLRSLAREKLAIVNEAGERLCRVVALADARGSAPLSHDDQMAARGAGFVNVLFTARYAPAEEIVTAIKPLLTFGGGEIARVGTGALILLSEVATRLPEIERVIALIDQPVESPSIVRVPARFLKASALAQQAKAAATARDALTRRPVGGDLLATADEGAVLVIATAATAPVWEALLAELDAPPALQTRTLGTAGFALPEVATLIESACRIEGPRGSGSSWKLVRDTLSGSLIVTASPAEMELAEDLLARLADLPSDERREFRRFRIRHRSLEDLRTTLESILAISDEPNRAAGATVSSSSEPEAGTTPVSADQRADTAGGGGGTIAGRRQEEVGPGGEDREDDRAPRAAPRSRRREARGDRPSIGDEVSMTVDPATSSLIVMAPARQLERIAQLVNELDVRERQLMLEVFIANLSDRDLLDLGVSLRKIAPMGSATALFSSVFGDGTTSAMGEESGLPLEPPLRPLEGGTGVVLDPGSFSVVVQALQSVASGRTLVIPKVLVDNGEEAILDSVRKEPVQSTNASATVATTSFSRSVEAGTKITVVPQIAEGDHVLLEYDVSLSTFVGKATSPALPPPSLENNLRSVVTVPDGYTVVLGGLQTITEAQTIRQVPLLGDIPWLGEIFRTRSVEESTARFYVFIRPTILRGSDFALLRELSRDDLRSAEVDEGWPEMEPATIP